MGKTESVQTAMLAWYDRERRILPWRAPPGATPDPYRVWLSRDHAAADDGEGGAAALCLLPAPLAGCDALWRKRSLARCSPSGPGSATTRAPATCMPAPGRWPTAGAASFPRPRPNCARCRASAATLRRPSRRSPSAQARRPVDGNIERVVARLFAVTEPLPGAKPSLRKLAAALTPEHRAGDFAQGLMDLGATICTPSRPACGLCPLRPDCAGYAEGLAEVLPYRAGKASRPVRRGVAYVVLRDDGAVLLRERPPKGLLGGMLEVLHRLGSRTARSTRTALSMRR